MKEAVRFVTVQSNYLGAGRHVAAICGVWDKEVVEGHLSTMLRCSGAVTALLLFGCSSRCSSTCPVEQSCV